MKETFPAIYVDGLLKLKEPLAWLENNTAVRVTVTSESTPADLPTESPAGPLRGDPETLFAAVDALPPMSDEDAALILRIVEEELRQVDPADWQ